MAKYTNDLRRHRLEETVEPLSDVSSKLGFLVVAPVVLTVLVITVGYVVNGGEAPGLPPHTPTAIYGVSNIGVVVALWYLTDRSTWRAIAPFERPTARELPVVLGVSVLAIGIGWPGTTLVADAIGVAPYQVPSITSTAGLVAYGFGAVIVAPYAEEVLYRGLFVGLGIARGYSAVVAGSVSLLMFGVMHVFTAGAGGVVNALLLGTVLTWFRFHFDSLSGAWFFHALNNLLELLVAVSVFPSLYALG